MISGRLYVFAIGWVLPLQVMHPERVFSALLLALAPGFTLGIPLDEAQQCPWYAKLRNYVRTSSSRKSS